MLFCADGNGNSVRAGSQAQSADWVIVVAVIIGEVLPKRMVKLPLSRYICARGNHNGLCGHDKRGAQRRPVVFESKSQSGSKCGRHMYVHIDKFTAKKNAHAWDNNPFFDRRRSRNNWRLSEKPATQRMPLFQLGATRPKSRDTQKSFLYWTNQTPLNSWRERTRAELREFPDYASLQFSRVLAICLNTGLVGPKF